MPTWGWFIVALVVIDLAVMVTWLIVKSVSPSSRARTNRPESVSDTDIEMRRLKYEGNAVQAITMLNTRTGVSVREAKDTVDRL